MDKPWELIRNLERRGYTVEARDGQFLVKGAGVSSLPASTRQLIADNRDQLLECLESRQLLADTLAAEIDKAAHEGQLELALDRTTAAHGRQQLTGSQVEALARKMVARARRLHREPGVIYQPHVTA